MVGLFLLNRERGCVGIKSFNDLSAEQQEYILGFERTMFAKVKEQIVQDLINSRSESYIGRKYTAKDLADMLEYPTTSSNMQRLRQMSLWLYITSPQYRRLINYYSTLPTFNYYIVPDNVLTKELTAAKDAKFRKNYIETINDFERYTMKQTAPQAISLALLQGAFCGIIIEDEHSFWLKSCPINYVKILLIADNCFRFAFDMSYFTSSKYLLEAYGAEFEQAYVEYQRDTAKRWYVPSKQICIKPDSDPTVILPFFLGVFKEILDLEDYRTLAKAKTEIENYKVLVMKQDTDDDGVPKLDFNIAMKYYNQAAQNLPSGIGLILSPFSIDDFSFNSPNVGDTDAVNKARDSFWAASGSSPLIFGSTEATTSSALILSTKPDEQITFALLDQIERNFNLLQKYKGKSYSFKIRFLRQSIYNKEQVQDTYSKAAMYGVTGAKIAYAASLDFSPVDLVNLAYLEDSVLGLTIDSYNKPIHMNANGDSESASDGTNIEGGRPTNESKGIPLTESGEADKDTNQNDNVV